MEILRKLLYLLNFQDKKYAIFALDDHTNGILDMIGVASILPFIAILSNPETIETNSLLRQMFGIANLFGIQTIPQFTSLGILVFMLLVCSLALKALTTYSRLSLLDQLNTKLPNG